MPTILELFKGSEKDTSVEMKTETRIEQEVTGVRFTSGVELNNPARYSTDAVRIALRSTATKDSMTGSRGVDGGLVGKGLEKITDGKFGDKVFGGQVSSLAQARDKITSRLGIPTREIPTSVYNRIKLAGDLWDTSKPVQGMDSAVTELANILKDAGGSPGAIKEQITSKGVALGKKKLREIMLGKQDALAEADGDERGFIQKYTSNETKSKNTSQTLETYRGISNDVDIVNLVTTSDNIKPDKNGVFEYSGAKYKDLIPFYIGRYGSDKITMFRANLTGINESVSPSWNSHKFLGNPFNFYTYSGVERSVTFNLQIYAGSKPELATNWEKLTELTRLTYPIQTSQKLVNPPIISFRLGDIYNTKNGYIDSLSYTLPDNGTWETEENGMLLPKFIDVAITIKLIESMDDVYSANGIYGFEKSKGAKDAIKQNSQENKISTEPITRKGVEGQLKMDAKVKGLVDRPSPFTSINQTMNQAQIKGIQLPTDKAMGEIADGSSQSALTDKLGGKSILKGFKKLFK